MPSKQSAYLSIAASAVGSPIQHHGAEVGVLCIEVEKVSSSIERFVCIVYTCTGKPYSTAVPYRKRVRVRTCVKTPVPYGSLAGPHGGLHPYVLEKAVRVDTPFSKPAKSNPARGLLFAADLTHHSPKLLPEPFLGCRGPRGRCKTTSFCPPWRCAGAKCLQAHALASRAFETHTAHA